jgi:hypothetical protein
MNERRQKNKQIKLDEFSNISLWQLLPCGNGKGLKKLREITNSILNGQAQRETNKPLSLLIHGPSGKRTHAYAFLKAQGIEYIHHSPASVLYTTMDFYEFLYGAMPEAAYLISDLNLLNSGNCKKLYQVLSQGHFSYMNAGGVKIEVPVLSTIVCTVKKLNFLPDTIISSFEHVVELGEYTDQQKELIALQRLKYSNIEIEEEDVLKKLLLLSPSDLSDLIKLLNLSITVMMADGRSVLTVEDIRRGKEMW